MKLLATACCLAVLPFSLATNLVEQASSTENLLETTRDLVSTENQKTFSEIANKEEQSRDLYWNGIGYWDYWNAPYRIVDDYGYKGGKKGGYYGWRGKGYGGKGYGKGYGGKGYGKGYGKGKGIGYYGGPGYYGGYGYYGNGYKKETFVNYLRTRNGHMRWKNRRKNRGRFMAGR